MVVHMYQCIQHHIPEKRIFYHHCENLKSSCIRHYCFLGSSKLQHTSEEHNVFIFTWKYFCHRLHGNIKPRIHNVITTKGLKTSLSSRPETVTNLPEREAYYASWILDHPPNPKHVIPPTWQRKAEYLQDVLITMAWLALPSQQEQGSD